MKSQDSPVQEWAGVGASPAEGSPRAGRRRRRASLISHALAAATSAAAVALSVLARRERARARYWRSAAELELHLHNPAKLLRLQAAHAAAPGRLSVVRDELFARSVRLIAGRPFNQSRAGAVTPARVSL